MKLFKKVSAGLLLSFGFICLIVSASVVSEKNPTQEDKDTFWGGLMFGLPLVAGGGAIVWGLQREHQQKLLARAQDEEARLREIFFELVDRNSGKINVLSLAKEAKISGDEARHYLDSKSREFDATFDVGEQGEMTYQFHV